MLKKTPKKQKQKHTYIQMESVYLAHKFEVGLCHFMQVSPALYSVPCKLDMYVWNTTAT